MSSLFQIASAMIRWGLVLGACGGLAHATIVVMEDAANETQSGLVSLGHLNRQLLNGSHHHRLHLQGK